MGLDITAYSHLTLAPTQCKDPDEGRTYDYCYSKKHIRVYFNPHFPHATLDIADLDEACLVETDQSDSYGWRAGSYGGYGIWRSTLALFSFGIDTYERQSRDENWTELAREENREKAFWELINFSDCEGIMGPRTSAKLYWDFWLNRENYVDFVTNKNPYPGWEAKDYIARYDDWMHGFDLARHDGIVDFH